MPLQYKCLYSHCAVPLKAGGDFAPLHWNVLNNFLSFLKLIVHFLDEIIFSLVIVFSVQILDIVFLDIWAQLKIS